MSESAALRKTHFVPGEPRATTSYTPFRGEIGVARSTRSPTRRSLTPGTESTPAFFDVSVDAYVPGIPALYTAFKEALVERFAREVLPKLATGRLEHIIDRVFVGLEQAQAAHEYMESNANVGKIVLKLA